MHFQLPGEGHWSANLKIHTHKGWLLTFKICKIADNKCTIILKDLQDDQYAIRYIHDENRNEELDINILGIPKEGLGFSNDAFGKFGPKDFSEWLFEVSGDTKIRMTTKYLF